MLVLGVHLECDGLQLVQREDVELVWSEWNGRMPVSCLADRHYGFCVLNVACPKWKVDLICNVAALRFDWFRNYGDSWCQRFQLPELSTLVVGWDRHSGEADIVFIHVLCSFPLLFFCV